MESVEILDLNLEGFSYFGSQIKIIQLVNNFQREYIFFLNIHLERISTSIVLHSFGKAK